MAAAFSTNAEETLSKSLTIAQRKQLPSQEIESFYEISKCAEFIGANCYKIVALQFPDDLLQDSLSVSKLIANKAPSAKVYILGDTSYGSCCVDEVAAEHIKADCIIHFGKACLSPTRRLPVLYVYGVQCLDVNDCHLKVLEIIPDLNSNIILFHDVAYQHTIEKLFEMLKTSYRNIVLARLAEDNSKLNKNICERCGGEKTEQQRLKTTPKYCGNACRDGGSIKCEKISKLTIVNYCTCDDKDELSEDKINSDSNFNRLGRSFTLMENTQLDDYKMLFIGKESSTLTNLLMTYNKNKFYTYNPERKSARKEDLNVNKALMKRYYLIEKAKDAKTVGIVAGTLGVADYLQIIERLKRLLKQAGKKFYTFMMGKLNVPKMANFMEVDIFVLVACPENSLIDSQEFYKPIVTPFEMEIACSRARKWTGEYITDFRELLPGAASHIDFEDSTEDENNDEPEFSLISGGLIKRHEETKEQNGTDSTEIIPRNCETTVSTFGPNSAAHFLHSRTWQGLEKDLGKTEVAAAVEGRKGISTGYTHEIEHNDT